VCHLYGVCARMCLCVCARVCLFVCAPACACAGAHGVRLFFKGIQFEFTPKVFVNQSNFFSLLSCDFDAGNGDDLVSVLLNFLVSLSAALLSVVARAYARGEFISGALLG